MRTRIFIGLALASGLLAGCQQHLSRYETHVPGPSERHMISPEILPYVTARAEKGSLEAAVKLSRHYLYSTKDSDSGIKWLRAAAVQGDFESIKWLSDLLRMSARADERAESFVWLREAARRGDRVSKRRVAATLIHQNAPAERAEGIAWLIELSDEGDAWAKEELRRQADQRPAIPPAPSLSLNGTP